MDFNLITNIKSCYVDIPHLLYYSHIPTAVIAFLLGLFIYTKKRDLVSKILFFISLIFSLWILLSLYVWLGHDSRLMMYAFSLFGILNVLLFSLSFYLVYVYVEKVDVSWKWKLFWIALMSPFIIFHAKNVSGFDLVNCEAIGGNNYFNLIYIFELVVFLWVLVYGVYKIIKDKTEFRKQIILLVGGIELFLFSFFATGFFASYLADKGVAWSFELEQYGLFGMTFFMMVLGYMIVKFKAFEIKLIGAQALVVSLIILIGSQFFFIENNTNKILTGITLFLSMVFGYILVRSVQEEVRQKEALEIANAEINARKDELQNMANKLANANDELRKLDNAKTEFLSIASHQLRTPLTAIKGFVSLLLEGSYGEMTADQKGALEKVYSSGERLIQLVEDLLNVSRIESGRMQFVFENANIGNLAKELYENFLLVAKTKHFYLDLKIAEDLPEIPFDYSKVRELISNFVDNALKYTEKGGVTITVEKRESGVVIDENGFVIRGKESVWSEVIRVTVSDTGIGVPKEEIPYLFKKFSRGKDVSRLHVGGTGLGLYVGKAIAEAHHGAVWIESEGAGTGSRFIIELPVKQA